MSAVYPVAIFLQQFHKVEKTQGLQIGLIQHMLIFKLLEMIGIFLRGNFNFNTVAQQQTYTDSDAGISSDFGNWKNDSFRCSKDSNFVDEQLMAYMDYPTFRNLLSVWKYAYYI